MNLLYRLYHHKEHSCLKRKFIEIGVEVNGLEDVSIEIGKRILKEITFLLSSYPQIHEGFLAKINIGSFKYFYNKGLIAEKSINSYGITFYYEKEGRLCTELYFNSDRFSEKDLLKRARVIKCNDELGLESIIAHEFGHMLEFYILYKEKKWDVICPSIQEINHGLKMEENICGEFKSEETDIIRICEEAIKENGYSKEFQYRILDSVGYILGPASNMNYQECFAEAIAQYYCCRNHSKLSEFIIHKFENLINIKSKE